ncbi:O-antigen ligase family protein [Pseudomonas sp. PDM17]|uniref:O-antigen ligase family protein n=1 Tax=Pseudomonas sp. PDM17 TaxID=2769285 RepID=UPI0017848568|nr:O-antigen ligase family protein [Pseudomonas sp. PDM17]MBD9502574.1 O-antigen ligase family protein [Pseudomonas sp. PDM17]
MPLLRPSLANTTFAWLTGFILPFGWFCLLTGMFWTSDRTYYHKLYYLLVALPTFVALLCRPQSVLDLLRNPLVQCFLAFSAYMMLSLQWSDTDNSVAGIIKRPLYIFLLFSLCALLTQRSSDALTRSTQLAALASSLCALGSLLWFLHSNYNLLQQGIPEVRLAGYGALYNPLLTSHVYGFFTAWWLASWLSDQRRLPLIPITSVLILSMLILATGSRTPLVGLAVTLLWLTLLDVNRKSLLLLACVACASAAVFCIHPETLLQRGYSYRPQIWSEALRQFQESPWFGHGLEHPIRIKLEDIPDAFAEPHNIQLAVLICGGLAGWALWTLMYGVALAYCIRERQCARVRGVSALLVFGLTAGMTEGGSFISRPKEHWFLIWIPLAMLAGLWIARQSKAISGKTSGAAAPGSPSNSRPAEAASPAARAPVPCPGERT